MSRVGLKPRGLAGPITAETGSPHRIYEDREKARCERLINKCPRLSITSLKADGLLGGEPAIAEAKIPFYPAQRIVWDPATSILTISNPSLARPVTKIVVERPQAKGGRAVMVCPLSQQRCGALYHFEGVFASRAYHKLVYPRAFEPLAPRQMVKGNPKGLTFWDISLVLEGGAPQRPRVIRGATTGTLAAIKRAQDLPGKSSICGEEAASLADVPRSYEAYPEACEEIAILELFPRLEIPALFSAGLFKEGQITGTVLVWDTLDLHSIVFIDLRKKSRPFMIVLTSAQLRVSVQKFALMRPQGDLKRWAVSTGFGKPRSYALFRRNKLWATKQVHNLVNASQRSVSFLYKVGSHDRASTRAASSD